MASRILSPKMNDTLGNGTNSSTDYLVLLSVTTGSIYMVLGLPVNSYVLWLILSGAGGTIASEFFYLNLTVSMIISYLATVFDLAFIVTHNMIFFYVLVFVYLVCFWFSAMSFQCCICVERYIAVVHPVMFLRYKALRYRVACCCVVWLMGLAFSSLQFWSERVLNYTALGFNIVCVSVASFCCFSVLRALKQPGPGEGQKRDGGEGNDMKRRAFKIILISLVVMLVTTMCQFTDVVAILTDGSQFQLNIIYTIVMTLGFVHPLLYIYKAGKLQCFKGF